MTSMTHTSTGKICTATWLGVQRTYKTSSHGQRTKGRTPGGKPPRNKAPRAPATSSAAAGGTRDQPHPQTSGPSSLPPEPKPLGSVPQLPPPTPGEATPFQIVKAQELLSQAMPFLTQDAAQLVAGAHGLLTTWTEALWGEPIVLLDDSQATLPAEEAPKTNLAQAS